MKDVQKIRAVFCEALEKETQEARDAYIARACKGDPNLREEVEALFKKQSKANDFFKGPLIGPETVEDEISEGPGTKIGSYKLLQLIGEGGFGVVYMAEQESPIRRRVALKIIKLGMDTKQVIARFDAERQALAMMDHPNIARVFDAGATETGRPYFVMELVKGIPITEYCDKNNLDAQQRLELFIDVCKAVQHAHQKGIIHRDIKPSNVMITLHDGKPMPKIIDFGIAKATQHRLTEKTLFTEFRQFIGTPEYMSPEQAEMSGLDVDTRSDIYSLGVLLYELLTSTTPFEAEKLRSAAYDEVRRIIREDEPPKPSTRLSTLGDTLTDVAKHRHVHPGELCKIVHGDLDWIVMKSLEKDRTRRYETANELAQDIQRHLQQEPVLASPPSAVYRIRKFVQRNKTMVMGVGIIFVVLLAGSVVSTIFAVRAEREAKISKAVSDFLNEDLLASVEPGKAKAPEVTVRYILDAASEELEGKFKVNPLVEATVRQTLGETYGKLGENNKAESNLERALQIRQEQLGKKHPDTLGSMDGLARVYDAQGRYDEAEQLHIKTLEIRRRVLGEEHPDTLDSMDGLAGVYWDQRRLDEAEQLFKKTLEIRRRVLGEEHPGTLGSMGGLAWAYMLQGRYDETEQLHIKILEIRRRLLGEEHPDTLDSMFSLAWVYVEQRRNDEAEQLFKKTLEIRRRVLGEEHPGTLGSMDGLASTFFYQGRYDEAEQLCIKILEIERRVLGEEHPGTLRIMGRLAQVYEAQGRYDEAEQILMKTLEIRRRVLGEEHHDTLRSMAFLAWVYGDQGRYDEAEQLHKKTLEIRRRVLGDEHPYTLGSMEALAEVYRYQGRYDEAEQLHKKTLEIRRRVLGEEHPDTLVSMFSLAWVYGDQGRYDEAEQLHKKTLEIRRRVRGDEHPYTLGSMAALAEVYRYQGRYDEAEQLLKKTLEIRRRVLGEEHPETVGSMNNLAWLKVTCPAPQVRNGKEAIKYATRVCELTDWQNANYIDTLAAAYAEAGDFESAVKRQRQAIDLLAEDTSAETRADYESHLKLYQAGKALAARQETAGKAAGQINEKDVAPEKKK